MKSKDVDFIIDKAKSKNDGCYRIRNIAYRVVSSHVTHFAHRGEIFQFEYGFLVHIGVYEFGMASDESGQKILKKIKQ